MNYKKVGICVLLIVVISLQIPILYFVVKKQKEQRAFNSSVNEKITNLENTSAQNTTPIPVSTPKAEPGEENVLGIHKFSVINPCEGKLYCNYDSTVLGSVNNSICENLPDNMDNLGYIYSFAYYDGYIYYLTGDLGGGIIPAAIYKYDINKKSSLCIADNAQTVSACYIVNKTLLYETAEFDKDKMIEKVGIGKINLQTEECDEIYTIDVTPHIGYCQEDGIYIKTHPYSGTTDYFCMDYNGNKKRALSGDEMKIFDDFISDHYAYSCKDGVIYQYDLDKKETKNYMIPNSIDQYKLMQDSGCIVNIIDNKIYYSISAQSDSEELRMVNSLLLRCDMNGENTEIVASRFQP